MVRSTSWDHSVTRVEPNSNHLKPSNSKSFASYPEVAPGSQTAVSGATGYRSSSEHLLSVSKFAMGSSFLSPQHLLGPHVEQRRAGQVLAAIANHYTAGNVGSERRSEKDRALADVVHRAHAPQRNGVDELFLSLRAPQPLHAFGPLDGSGDDAVRANTIA